VVIVNSKIAEALASGMIAFHLRAVADPGDATTRE
jgi:hypothetical protein